MAKLPSAFTADGEEMADFTAMPRGTYPFAFDKNEVVLTNKAKEADDPSIGQMLKLQAKCLSGKYKGRVVFVQLNIVNENPEAVEIANREMTSICKAVGLEGVDDGDELMGIPFMGTVKIVSDKNGKYPDKNEFAKYAPYDEDAATAGAGGEPKTPNKPKTGGKKKKSPWEK